MDQLVGQEIQEIDFDSVAYFAFIKDITSLIMAKIIQIDIILYKETEDAVRCEEKITINGSYNVPVQIEGEGFKWSYMVIYNLT
ncbi:11180_t:CDS:2 [Funneliformis caledonium]|uniref:11180_t:CDS:1 n=1 Tax=Funneliformis caledonium TaxID=1117310 RepID=A0A9N9BVS6_9GLOM|nr:11180_t:CDS:2 [Funneliformis caledonium]